MNDIAEQDFLAELAAEREAVHGNALAEMVAESAVNDLPLSGETVAFTGTLASMTHKAAMELVEKYGGRATHSVSGSTTLLIIGEEGWPLEDDGRTSQKVQQAAQLVTDGRGIRIIAESDWLQTLGLDDQREEIRRAHTPAMLSRLLDVPVRLIRRWARLGLIRPVRRVCRLPYFDYREVASARRLAALLEEGVSPETIEHSLSELSKTIAGTDRTLAQLNLLVMDEKVLVRDDRGMLNPRTGQRLLDFEGSEKPTLFRPADQTEHDVSDDADSSETISVPFRIASDVDAERPMAEWNAEEWFHEACRLTEESELESAVNAFRNTLSLLGAELNNIRMKIESGDHFDDQLSLFPDPADVHFHLADALYRLGKPDAAVERYHCAIETAPDFIEAWTQLGCLQSEQGDNDGAEQSFRTALSIHPGNPDALLHYAQLLDRTDRNSEAVDCWKQYLRFDSRGPWSEHARNRIAGQLTEQESHSH